MKKIYTALMSLCLILIVSCKNEKKEDTTQNQESTEIKKLKLELESKSNSTATGSIVFTQEDDTVNMVAVLNGLTSGTHAIHIHEKADCSSPDGKSTGGHWNPTKQQHGKWGDNNGYHKGDIGNLNADEEGNAHLVFSTNEWCIGCDDPTKNIVGKAIIVHQGTDDFISQPTGAAGGRVSCGGIIQ